MKITHEETKALYIKEWAHGKKPRFSYLSEYLFKLEFFIAKLYCSSFMNRGTDFHKIAKMLNGQGFNNIHCLLIRKENK